ncbi:hypothetical protein SAMN04488688_102266 [Paenibacillus sp. cl141a]|nr:hypothetical protein SAMN04488688_102266 [Paenibacillus sp. cl141a]
MSIKRGTPAEILWVNQQLNVPVFSQVHWIMKSLLSLCPKTLQNKLCMMQKKSRFSQKENTALL